MPLDANRYGKDRIRLSKVVRRGSRSELREVEVSIRFEGDFAASYTDGDNRAVLPTDTMKNSVYVVGHQVDWASIEELGQALTERFLSVVDHLDVVEVALAERPWRRIGGDHPIAFERVAPELRTAAVTARRGEAAIASGLQGLPVAKTTGSAFEGFLRDEWTTLPEAAERMLATTIDAGWSYRSVPTDYDDVWKQVRAALVETFADHESRSVQHTLLTMGEAALVVCGDIDEIRLFLPNAHHLAVDLTPFGIEEPPTVFQPVDDPAGAIEGTVIRRAQ